MSEYRILNKVNSPQDLGYLNGRQLRRYCVELRHFLIHSVSHTGGHLASNLGVVELAVAIHRVFRSPRDQIIWDVGHQSYPHKIITGRREAMATLRQKNGISGFPKRAESPHDAFLTAHSTTSISLADGIAAAKKVLGEEGRVIAVIGDGAFTGGMAYEGLNNITRWGTNPIVILNDNKMSISKNVGSINTYLSKLRNKKSYYLWKDLTKSALHNIPRVGETAVGVVSRSKAYLKNAVYNTSFFEELGFVYLGPVDGHNLRELQTVLDRARSLNKPVFLHVETVKGKGYELAENNPGAYHGVPSFDPLTGTDDPVQEDSFSIAMGRCLTGLAEADGRICAVTAAMKYGTGLHGFAHRFGRDGRFFDVGIAEQHAVTFCAGMASKGLLPVFAVYSSFLQRSYDQILHDCSIEPVHVVLAVDRAGLVGADGETHQGIFDCAFLSTVPGAVIYAPGDYRELEWSLHRALYHGKGVCAVRYPRGRQPELPAGYRSDPQTFAVFGSGTELLVVTYGRQFAQVCEAVRSLPADEGCRCAVLKLTRVWPLPGGAVQAAGAYGRILFVEEGIRNGGIGEHFLAALQRRGFRGSFRLRAITGHVAQGTVEEQLRDHGLDVPAIAGLIQEQLQDKEHFVRQRD